MNKYSSKSDRKTGRTTIPEEDGLDFGRDLENNTRLTVDPFNRGVSPHIITFGISRAGKVAFASQAGERWYSEGEDRTLIALDTRGVFASLTKTLAGERIGASDLKQSHQCESLVDEDATGFMDADVDMAYLDLRQFRHSTPPKKSTMYRLMLDHATQTVKRTEGETILLIDEANFLLHSVEMVNWLQKIAREWARNDACLWFCSQSPWEFIAQTTGGAGENKRRTIYEQCSTVQFFRTPRESDETFAQFGLNPNQIDFLRTQATPGGITAGHTEYLLKLADHDDWLAGYLELSPEEVTL